VHRSYAGVFYRGAGLGVVRQEFLAVAGVATLFLMLSLIRFPSALNSASSQRFGEPLSRHCGGLIAARLAFFPGW